MSSEIRAVFIRTLLVLLCFSRSCSSAFWSCCCLKTWLQPSQPCFWASCLAANAEVTQAPSTQRSARAPRCGQPSPLGGGSKWLSPSSWFPINYSLGRQSGCRHLGWRLQSHSLWLLLCTTLARHFMRNKTQFDISYWPHVLLSNTKVNLWRS